MTAMATVDGHLVIAAGNRVETHAWNSGRLQRTAFYDAQVMQIILGHLICRGPNMLSSLPAVQRRLEP